ncbi:MAG: AAA family ATPase [Kiritimatiellae bacterium]|nr:AAA family ATPase [Kiritimatiellia bacterium]
MKIAITGKGGVGKSTLAAALALLLARRGRRVLAVDADPDANLAAALGLPAAERARIVPIAMQAALIEARTGAQPGRFGQAFKMNPEVADIADAYAWRHQGVALLVLGAVQRGGGGCACPENVLLKALVSNVVLRRDDALIMDMEAGIEHLGRGTTAGVDNMVIVVEPGQRSLDTARQVRRLGAELGIRRFSVVANKIASPDDEAFVRAAFGPDELLGVIPYAESLRGADRDGCSVLDGLPPELLARFEEILRRLEGEQA